MSLGALRATFPVLEDLFLLVRNELVLSSLEAVEVVSEGTESGHGHGVASEV